MRPTRSSSATHEVIESVVHLTEQRDELTLLRSLQESILEMLPAARVSLVCQVPGAAHGEWKVDPECPLPEPMFSLSDRIIEAAAKLSAEAPIAQVDTDGESYLIISLGLRPDRRKAIVIGQPEWTDADRKVAEGMLKIYSNYARMLFDSERDTLTGMYNRKKLEQKLSEILAARIKGYSRERDEGMADYLAVLDIDHFKRINDGFGHLIGDEVLIIFSSLVRGTLRDVDWVFRYGGEEFVVLVKGVSPDTVRAIMERIRARIEAHAFPQVGSVTVSIGYTAIVNQTLPTFVFEEADKALYYAKEHGRNQVCDYGALVNRGEIAVEAPASGSIDLF